MQDWEFLMFLEWDFINRNDGYDYIVSPFWKREVAEDIYIHGPMLFLKIVVIFMVINVFGHNLMIQKARTNHDLVRALFYSIDFFNFASDLLAFEIAIKFFVCLYEAVLTTFFNVTTLGRHAIGLSTKYVEAVLQLDNNYMYASSTSTSNTIGLSGDSCTNSFLTLSRWNAKI